MINVMVMELLRSSVRQDGAEADEVKKMGGVHLKTRVMGVRIPK